MFIFGINLAIAEQVTMILFIALYYKRYILCTIMFTDLFLRNVEHSVQ